MSETADLVLELLGEINSLDIFLRRYAEGDKDVLHYLGSLRDIKLRRLSNLVCLYQRGVDGNPK